MAESAGVPTFDGRCRRRATLRDLSSRSGMTHTQVCGSWKSGFGGFLRFNVTADLPSKSNRDELLEYMNQAVWWGKCVRHRATWPGTHRIIGPSRTLAGMTAAMLCVSLVLNVSRSHAHAGHISTASCSDFPPSEESAGTPHQSTSARAPDAVAWCARTKRLKRRIAHIFDQTPRARVLRAEAVALPCACSSACSFDGLKRG